jgi:hypothetical protein
MSKGGFIMPQMPDIDNLIAADKANVQKMRRVFADYSPELPELLNTASVLYQTCCRAFGQTVSDEAASLVDSSAAEGMQAKLQRGLLLARIGVLYSTAVTDFLRMRLTIPLVCVRLQCESLALIKLIFENPSVSRQWMDILTDEDGRVFFRQYQERVKSILRSYYLAEVYDQTSGEALHSRFIGLARGYTTTNHNDGYRATQSHLIRAQEFDVQEPDYFMVQVFHVLRIQAQIFASLKDAAPEINDPILLETRLPQFIRRVDRLFRRFGEQFKKHHPLPGDR